MTFRPDFRGIVRIAASELITRVAYVARLLVARDQKLLVGLAARESAFARGLLQRRFAVRLPVLHDFFHAPRQRHRASRRSAACPLSAAWSVRRPDQQRDFAARRFFPHGRNQIFQMPAQKLLVDFGHFARDHGRTVAENFERVFERIEQPVRRFVERERSRLRRQRAKRFSAFRFAATAGIPRT